MPGSSCMLPRHLTGALRAAAAANPVVTLTGPRQSGKTTLVRAAFPAHRYLSLEAPDERARRPAGRAGCGEGAGSDSRRDPAGARAAVLHPGARRRARRTRPLHPDRLAEPAADGVGLPDAGGADGALASPSVVAGGAPRTPAARSAESRRRRRVAGRDRGPAAEGSLADPRERVLPAHSRPEPAGAAVAGRLSAHLRRTGPPRGAAGVRPRGASRTSSASPPREPRRK